MLSFIFIAVSVGLAWYLLANDRGPKEPVVALWAAAGFGLAGAVMAIFLNAFIPSFDLLVVAPHSHILLAALGVGLIEEGCKFLPLALWIYRKPYFNEHTDGVIYFALAGLAFGLPENILYTMQYGSDAVAGRLFLTPFFHAAITGLVGYWLARTKLSGRPAAWAALPFLAAVGLHGLYDFGLVAGTPLYLGLSVLVTLVLSAGLFVAYLRATHRDQNMGLSAAGNSLGQPLQPRLPRTAYHRSMFAGAATAARQSGEMKALLSLLFGITGIVGAAFIPIVGLAFGVTGIVLATLSLSAMKRATAVVGIVFAGLAIVAGLASWVYAVQNTDDQLKLDSQLAGTPAKTASRLSTPCYSAGLVDTFNVSNETKGCDAVVYNGANPTDSSEIYKIYASKSRAVTQDTFAGIARETLEKDVAATLPEFTIENAGKTEFAGSPAYTVLAVSDDRRTAVMETAVFHPTGNGENVFVVTHSVTDRAADLQLLEAGWKWK